MSHGPRPLRTHIQGQKNGNTGTLHEGALRSSAELSDDVLAAIEALNWHWRRPSSAQRRAAKPDRTGPLSASIATQCSCSQRVVVGFLTQRSDASPPWHTNRLRPQRLPLLCLTDSQPTVLVPWANVASELLHTTGTLSYPATQFSGRTDNVPSHFPQARFWTTSGLPTTRPNGTHLTQAAPARRTKNFTCEIVLSSEFRKR
jgi:hypothetical protein